MAKHHNWQRSNSKTRKLRKQDKRAAVILMTLHAVSPKGFGLDRDGRYSYEWRCSYEYDEWDYSPALDYLKELESSHYFCACIDGTTGDMLPDDKCPPYPPSAMRQLPAGWRWRGRRVVPVDKAGAMVRAAAKEGAQHGNGI